MPLSVKIPAMFGCEKKKRKRWFDRRKSWWKPGSKHMDDDTGPSNEDTPHGYNAQLSLPSPASPCASSSQVSMEKFNSYSPSPSLSSITSYRSPKRKRLDFSNCSSPTHTNSLTKEVVQSSIVSIHSASFSDFQENATQTDTFLPPNKLTRGEGIQVDDSCFESVVDDSLLPDLISTQTAVSVDSSSWSEIEIRLMLRCLIELGFTCFPKGRYEGTKQSSFYNVVFSCIKAYTSHHAPAFNRSVRSIASKCKRLHQEIRFFLTQEQVTITPTDDNIFYHALKHYKVEVTPTLNTDIHDLWEYLNNIHPSIVITVFKLFFQILGEGDNKSAEYEPPPPTSVEDLLY